MKSSPTAKFLCWWIFGLLVRPLRMAAPNVAQTARELAGRLLCSGRYGAAPATRGAVQRPGDSELRRLLARQSSVQQAGLVDANTMKSWLTRAA